MFFEAAANARIIVANCERAGVSRERLLREANVGARQIDPPAFHIQWPDMKRLLDAGERLTGDPAFMLHADPAALAPQWGVVGQFVLAQRTVREAVREGLRMTGVMTNVIRFILEDKDGKARFQTHFAPVDASLRHIADMYLLFQLVFNRDMFVQSWCPSELRIRERPVEAAEYERIFGCPVRMDGEFDEMITDTNHLDDARVTYDPSTVDLLRPHYDAMVAAMSQNLQTTLWITAHLEAKLLRGDVPTLSEFARHVRTSVRTIAARLAEERTSYRQVLEGVRSRHALLLLRNPGTKLEAVAVQLGYSNAATFVRAFRRWTGMTPTEWRSARDGVASTPQNPG